MFYSVLDSMRIRHWVKNLFVFIPLIISGSFFNLLLIKETILAFLSFSFLASCIYLFNDIIDIESDRLHFKKKNRPIASGKISIHLALVVILVLLCTVVFLQSLSINKIHIIILSYCFVNINYSLWIKKIAIFDIICISSGFVLRVLAGVMATGLETSSWLIMMTFSLSMLLALGKRKSELNKINSSEIRMSLKNYSQSTIDNMQNIFITCSLIFYLLYTNFNDNFSGDKYLLYFSSIFVVAGLLRYIQISDDDNQIEEPTEILYNDKFIILSVFLWGVTIILSFL